MKTTLTSATALLFFLFLQACRTSPSKEENKNKRIQFKEFTVQAQKKATKKTFSEAFDGGFITLGTGINSATGEGKNTDVVISRGEVTDSTGGDEAESFNATMQTSISDLRNSMDMGFEGSGAVGIFSAGGKAEFLSSVNISNTSDYILVKVKVVNYAKQLLGAELSQTAIDKISNDSDNAFEYAGDSYVYEQVYGGELYILFSADSYSDAEKKQNSESMHAAIGLFSGGANHTQIEETFNKVTHLSIYMCRAGSRGYNFKTTTTVDSVLSIAGQFHEEARKHPTLIAVHTKPLVSLGNYPDVTRVNLLPQKFYLNGITRLSWQLKDIESIARYVKTAQTGTWDSTARVTADSIINIIEDRLVKLDQCRQTCEFDYKVSNCNTCQVMTEPLPKYVLNYPIPSTPTNPTAVQPPH